MREYMEYNQVNRLQLEKFVTSSTAGVELKLQPYFAIQKKNIN